MSEPTDEQSVKDQNPTSSPSSGKSRQLLVILIILALVGLLLIKITRSDQPTQPAQMNQAEIQAQINAAEEAARSELQEQNEKLAASAPRVGEEAPGFTVEGEDGPIRLTDYTRRGEPVVVEFIATWCPHCNKVAPIYAKVFKGRRDVSLLVVGVAGEPSKTVFRWHRAVGGVGDVASDTQGEAKEAYAVTGTPTTAFINARGKLRALVSGEMSASELRERTDEIAR